MALVVTGLDFPICVTGSRINSYFRNDTHKTSLFLNQGSEVCADYFFPLHSDDAHASIDVTELPAET